MIQKMSMRGMNGHWCLEIIRKFLLTGQSYLQYSDPYEDHADFMTLPKSEIGPN